jgi:hypothetical protein
MRGYFTIFMDKGWIRWGLGWGEKLPEIISTSGRKEGIVGI